ncbi:MAG: GTPase HflX [Candidatus Omnitrophica bacterium]|nr:GTPase HflX [Candidatus Omnitrophota bacterium]
MERALLVTVDLGKREEWTAGERSNELAELARSAGAKVIREEIAKRHELSPAYFIGEGKVGELSAICKAENINIAIFNNDLTGTQQKNLEETLGVKTIDRTQLILDIFARRAHSNEGKIQVELAQLMYLLPRLTDKGIHLSRPGGGIGTRGPGEQKLEIDRRRIRSRISHLKKELDSLSRRRSMMRDNRQSAFALTIAIIGYTNAGKSTLLNALTASDVVAQDRLFSTLDPTTRKLLLPNNQKALFIDTVGFLDRLPHHLIEAFKATLEEVGEADLLLHVVDVSHPKAYEEAGAVHKVLDELGVKDKPVITALNKSDKITDPTVIAKATAFFDNSVVISALKREGLSGLIEKVTRYTNRMMIPVKLNIPVSDTKTLNIIYENANIIKKEYTGDFVSIEAEIPRQLEKFLTISTQ